jgi:hypothetical protein
MIFTAPYSVASLGNLAAHFHPEHLKDLRDSGLNDETIKAAGVYSLRPCDLAHFFSARKGVPPAISSALCFPYQGGEFARIKLFPSLEKMKYAQPPNTGARLYEPFRVNDGPLLLCEGEKKTLAAKQAGFNAVVTGSVWNWLSHGEPIDDLKAIDWDGRGCTIIPDSDVFQRVELLRAIYALGRELRALGANVYLAELPQPASNKVGLDDFLAAGSSVDSVEIFRLDHRRFKSIEFWHRDWKVKKALRIAA